MKLVIDISEKTINAIKDNAMFAKEMASSIKWDITEAIANGTPVVIETPTWDYDKNYDNETCKYCGNNPKNGGSGVCHCTLATFKIT